MSTFGIGLGPLPDYADFNSNDRAKEHVQKASSNASSLDRAILAKESEEVPFVVQFSIGTDRAQAGHPSLRPSSAIDFVEDSQMKELSDHYYQELRNQLPAYLKEKLLRDEEQPFEDRDPDFLALDASLKFEADGLALTDRLSVSESKNEKILLEAKQYVDFPLLVQQQLTTYGSHVTYFLDDYLSKIGPNDPSYSLLINVSNQLKEALELLNKPRQTSS